MINKALIISFFFLSAGLIADNQTEPVNYRVRGFITEWIFEYFGSKPVSLQFENRIRELLRKHEFSFADSIDIRSFNRYLIKNNAGVLGYWIQDHLMFVDEKWLSEAPQEEFEFVILHEATHLSEHHTDLKLLAVFAVPVLSELAVRYATQNKVKSAWVPAVYINLFLLLPKLSRYLEYRADAGSAHCLGSIEGGVKTMNTIKGWRDDNESHCSQLWVLKLKRKIGKWIQDNLNMLASHPTEDRRIEALTNIEQYL